MSDLVSRIEAFIARENLLPKEQGIVVAVSGGLDSTVLLHLLAKLASRHQWSLTVAHCHHQLRGVEADEDQAHVAEQAAALKLPFVTERVDVRGLAAAEGLSLEMAARKLRHRFLTETARSVSAASIALAHHSDDQVELFFLRACRGAGSDGLGGMRAKRMVTTDGWPLAFCRPLLAERRADLLEYALANAFKFRDDTSNNDLAIDRNFIRHEIVARLGARQGQNPSSKIARSMELLRAEGDYLREQALQWLGGAVTSRFSELHLALQRRVIYEQLLAEGLSPDFSLVENLRTSKGAINVAPGRFVLLREDGRVEFSGGVEDRGFESTAIVVDLTAERRVEFDGLTVRWKAVAAGGLGEALEGRETFDADAVGSPITLRHWRAGDTFQPIGLPGTVKLQDYFTDRKIPAAIRRKLVVAESEAGVIFWVEGQRIGHDFRVTEATKTALEWHWHRSQALVAVTM